MGKNPPLRMTWEVFLYESSEDNANFMCGRAMHRHTYVERLRYWAAAGKLEQFDRFFGKFIEHYFFIRSFKLKLGFEFDKYCR